jgi:uroporphyrinogen decarboxylase
MESDRYNRVMAAVRREVPDRVPWAVWGHIPALPWVPGYSWEKATRDGEELARSHLALLRELDYSMDLLKVTPFFRFMAQQWGSTFRFRDNNGLDEMTSLAVKKTDDWEKLWVLDPHKELKEQLKAISILGHDLRRMPFIESISSPMNQALHGVSDPATVYETMRAQPDALKEGLNTIAQTCIDFSRACVDEGASGIFFGLGARGSFWSKMDREKLEEWELKYDVRILDAVDAPIKMLHICNTVDEDPQRNGGLMEDGWFKKFPVTVINWNNHTFTSISKAREVYGDSFSICGGVDHMNTLAKGTPKMVEAEARKAIRDAGDGAGFILGAGCTARMDTPWENVNAIGRTTIKYGTYRC